MRRQRDLLGAEIVRQVHFRRVPACGCGQLPEPPQQLPAVLVRHFDLGGLPQGLDQPRRAACLQRRKAIVQEHEALLEDRPRRLHRQGFRGRPRGPALVALWTIQLAAQDPALPRVVGLDVETEAPRRPVIPGQRAKVVELRLRIGAVLRPRQPVRGGELGQEELLHVLGQLDLRDAGRRSSRRRRITLHVVIAEEEIEDLGVFGGGEPADVGRPDAQLLELAELTVGPGFALQEKQDQLVGVVVRALVENVPDFARLRAGGRDRRGQDSPARRRRGPNKLLLPIGRPRFSATPTHSHKWEPAGRPARLAARCGRQIVVAGIVELVLAVDPRIIVRRSPPGPSAGCRAGPCRGGRGSPHRRPGWSPKCACRPHGRRSTGKSSRRPIARG